MIQQQCLCHKNTSCWFCAIPTHHVKFYSVNDWELGDIPTGIMKFSFRRACQGIVTDELFNGIK